MAGQLNLSATSAASTYCAAVRHPNLASMLAREKKGVKFKYDDHWVGAQAARDLGDAPIVPFDEGWRRTTAWFAAEWRPRWEAGGMGGKGEGAGG